MSGIKEIQLTDLANDNSFFDHLKKGKYILVLGAGFSFGLKSKAGGNIPLVREFVELTNKKFDRNPPLDNYNLAASEWQRYIKAGNTDDEKKARFDEFKNLFLLDEALFEAKKELFSNILVPPFKRIYTFNFDNVLECLLQGKNIPYEVQYSKVGSFDFKAPLGIGYMHNSILKANAIGDLIFTNEAYSQKLLRKDHHLYFSVLSDITTHEKNLLIIGAQFNEMPITTFLLNEEREVRSDLRIIHISYLAKPDYGDNTEELLNDSNWINCTTEDFLHFLQENKHKIQDISLEGAVIINKEFINGLHNGGEFTKSKFYSAKQDDNCQWYGILHNFDVIRENYLTIKREALHAFDTASMSKVAAVVHGTGGCGKSTLLRRLALELAQETGFVIVWVKDRNLGNFTLNALPALQADSRNKYLVFIEDWYRITASDPEAGKEILDAVQAINNIRLIIGDRDVKGKEYLLHLAKPESVFKLTENENEKILNEIIARHAEWQRSSEMILRNPASYNAPLFLILFAIAGISEARIDGDNINFSDLTNTVRRIAKYDLKKIAGGNTGLAKALYYWSCVYEKHKIFISYDTFLKIADHYNKNEEASNYYQNWDGHSAVLDKLRLYINVSAIERIEKKFLATNMVQFNHDKLSEDVLSKVGFEDWEPYDDIQQLSLLDVITEKGDSYSSASVLDAFLKERIFSSNQVKRSYIDKLLYKRNILIPYYLNHLAKLDLSATELQTYLAYLQKNGLYPGAVWLEYFRIATKEERQEASRELLANKDIAFMPHEVVKAVFSQAGNWNRKQMAVSHILTHQDLFSIRAHTVSIAFNWSRNDIEKKIAAKRILTHKELFHLSTLLVVKALRLPGNEAEKKAAIDRILSPEGLIDLHIGTLKVALSMIDDAKKNTVAKKMLAHKDLLSFHPQIMKWALAQPGNESEKSAAVYAILTNKNITDLRRHALASALAQPGYETEKQTIIKSILTDKATILLNPYILMVAFNHPGNEAEKQLAATNILTHSDLTNLNQPLISAAFKHLENDHVKQTAARAILTNKNLIHLNPNLLSNAFKYPGNETEKQSAADAILSNNDPVKINPNLLLTVFAQPGNEIKKQHTAHVILSDKAITRINPQILLAAFTQPGNEANKQAAANAMLKNKNAHTGSRMLLLIAFAQPANETEKKVVAKNILTYHYFFSLNPSIIKAAFEQAGNEEEKQAAANRIFAHADFLNLHPEILAAASSQPGNEEKKKLAEPKILQHRENTSKQPEA